MLKKENLGIGVAKGYTRGFSTRLNRLCDLAGLKSESFGRPSELAEITGLSRTGTRNWIKEDSIPRSSTLEVLVDSLLARIPEQIDKEITLYWLVNGGDSPFGTENAKTPNSYFESHDPFLVQKVFAETFAAAAALQVDLNLLSAAQLDALYSPLIKMVHQYPNLDIRDVITSNLLLAYPEKS